jgi:hypothetical protein
MVSSSEYTKQRSGNNYRPEGSKESEGAATAAAQQEHHCRSVQRATMSAA